MTKESSTPARSRLYVLWQLFSSMFLISSFTFGGGFVIINFMKRRFITQLKWIDEDEMTDMVSLAQSSPGAIAVNAANLLGWRMAGFPGMLAAALGTILPPMLILLIISTCYTLFAQNRYVSYALRGMQAGVAAIVLDVALQLVLKQLKMKNSIHIILMLLAFVAVFFFRMSPVWALAAAVLLGLLLSLLQKKKEGSK